MKQTTLKKVFERYQLSEYDVTTTLWESAQEDKEEHYIAIQDNGLLYIIDTYEIEEGTAGFWEGSVITLNC